MKRSRPQASEGMTLRTIVVLAAAAVLIAIVVALARPLSSDDLWLHLALGRAYASEGPWLTSDPILHTSTAPPVPATWLYGVLMDGVETLTGLAGVRWAHVLLGLGVLSLAGSILSRAGKGLGIGLPCLIAFAELSAYRLYQARPHLLSILFALATFRLLIEHGRTPNWKRVGAAIALSALWANVHAGFLLAPVIAAGGCLGALLESFRGNSTRDAQRRAGRLALAALGCLLASFVNPAGNEPHLALLVAGEESPALSRVGDEWAAPALFALPGSSSVLTPLSWGLTWLLGLACLSVVAADMRSGRRTIDPARWTLGLGALGGMLLALRFSWLSIFPLILLATAAASGHAATKARRRWLAAAVGLLVSLAFFTHGGWPLIAPGIPRSLEAFRQDYRADKYHAEALWFLRDAGLEGRVYNEYALGGFIAYHLGPDVRAFVAGTMNHPPPVQSANAAIQQPGTLPPGESITDRLDAFDTHLFIGVGLPRPRTSPRTPRYTTTHLEGDPGWILAFRSVDAAVYLRRGADQAGALDRVATYYEERSIPFDRARGFEAEQAIATNPNWARRNRLLPRKASALETALVTPPGRHSVVQLRMQADYRAALGRYTECAELSAEIARRGARQPPDTRRQLWCLLHLGNLEAARATLSELPPDDPWRNRLTATVTSLTREPLGARRRALLAGLPYLTPVRAGQLVRQFEATAPRERPDASPVSSG